VISPLLANVYLHDFDRAFHGPDGPAQFANARLVRYADDFVVLARYLGPRLLAWLERMLEQDLRLTLNRTKTRVVCVTDPQQSLDFLGFRLRYLRDRRGRPLRYLAVGPSPRAQARLREKLRGLTQASAKRSLRGTIDAVNTLLRGWSAYFRYGYPRHAFRAVTTTCRDASGAFSGIGANGAVVRFDREKVCMRVCTAMGSSPCDAVPSTSCVGLSTTRVGEPDAGNLHVRFDEGERLSPRSLLDC
jgi:hypothetical protein